MVAPTQTPLDLERRTLVELRKVFGQELAALDSGFEYFALSSHIDLQTRRAAEPIGRCRWIACYPVTGGSEGHYVHVDRIYHAAEFDRTFTTEPLFLYKTFGGWDAACKVAAYLATRLEA